jgi:hypothetical protein
VTARPEKHRERSRDADAPADEHEARERLLTAADACYAEKGPVRTLVWRLAAAAGEIRRNLLADTLARWIVRINFGFIAEPARPDDGGDEAMLQNLLVATLGPRA